LLGGVLFMAKYMNSHPKLVPLGLVMEGVALAGWGVLVANREMAWHFTGVGVFCCGSFVYSCIFLVLGSSSHRHLHTLHLWLMIFLLVTTGGLVLSFVALWAIEENTGQHAITTVERKAYLVEHAAYMAHLLFYLGFISFHSPGLDSDSLKACVYYEAEMMARGDEAAAVCQPLVHMDTNSSRRLQPIIEVVCETTSSRH
jgi:hypothetical protein